MQTTTTHCDICGNVISNRQEDDPKRLFVETFVGSQNPLWMRIGKFHHKISGAQSAHLEFQDVCERCRRSYSNGVADLLISMRHDIERKS